MIREKISCMIESTNYNSYYLSTERGSIQRHLFSVNISTKAKVWLSNRAINPVIPFLTDFDQETESHAGYYSVSFSPECEYYILAYEGPDVPWQELIAVNANTSTKLIDYASIRQVFSEKEYPKTYYTTIRNDAGHGNHLDE